MAKKIVRNPWYRDAEEVPAVPVNAAWLESEVPDSNFGKHIQYGRVYCVDIAAKERGDGINETMTALLKHWSPHIIVYGTGYVIEPDEDDDFSAVPDLVK